VAKPFWTRQICFIVWVGHRRIVLTKHQRPETVAPIRIVRDAFADNMPHTDLFLSPDHAVFVENVLICIRLLVNGSTIRTERGWTAVDYYHVELNDHAILLAEGLPAESYLDTGNRSFFANFGVPLTVCPDMTNETDYPTREAGSSAPFVWDEASVQLVWQRLADRAAAIGRPPLQHTTTTDADLRLLAMGASSNLSSATPIELFLSCRVAPARCGSSRVRNCQPKCVPGWRIVAGLASALSA
jgi:hypothetical protein